MILDCRRANLLFRAPPRTVLGSIEALGRVRLDGSAKDAERECLFIAQEDIRVCFYRMGIPEDMSPTSLYQTFVYLRISICMRQPGSSPLAAC